MRSMKLVPVCALLSAGLAAQAAPQVAPQASATKEGSSNNVFLFGRSNKVRIMDIYHKSVLPFSSSRMINGITLRMDRLNHTNSYPAKANIELSVDISTTHTEVTSQSRVFDDWHGNDRTRVFAARMNVPAQLKPAKPGTAVRPFNVTIPYDNPWFFQTSPLRGGSKVQSNLVLDYRVTDKPSGENYILDSCGFCRHVATQFGAGASCKGSNQKPLTLSVNQGVFAGSRLTYSISGALPKRLVLLYLTAGPLPPFVPMPIGNGSGCFINFAPLLTATDKADSKGKAVFRYPIPRGNKYRFLSIHAQAAAFDINANSGMHVASRGLTTKICGPYPVVQLMRLNDPLGTAKTSQSNVYGLAHVIQFQ